MALNGSALAKIAHDTKARALPPQSIDLQLALRSISVLATLLEGLTEQHNILVKRVQEINAACAAKDTPTPAKDKPRRPTS